MTRCSRMASVTFLWLALSAQAQAPVLPPGEKEPVLRLEAGGPTTYVTALTFSPDGQSLYASGWDKVVRVWTLNERKEFVLDRAAYRVPIGPGLEGAINAMALSPDGLWLAAAGMGIVRGGASFRRAGIVLPKIGGLTPEMRKDQGTIYVFNTRTRAVRLLRGHRGPVMSMAFAPAREGKPPLLAASAREWDDETTKFVGTVRLWDIDKAAAVDGISGLPFPDLGTRPDLALWHTGPKLKQLQVAIAWGDGSLRLWDLERDHDQVWKTADGKYNNTAAYLSKSGSLVTAGFHEKSGQLTLWQIAPEQGPVADAQRRISFPQQGEAFFFPRALALLPAQPGGDLDHAAVVLRVPDREEEYRLHVLDLTREHSGEVTAEVVLWKGGGKLPVLAADPRGRYLAVAGDKDHTIAIFGIADLLNRRGGPQILRSSGSTMRSVAWVHKGKALGLTLSESTKKDADKPIFDFTNRSLSADTEGWKSDAPDLKDWRVQNVPAKPKERPAVTVRQGEKETRRIELKENYLVTGYALLPPTKPPVVPLLAIAYLDDKVQPWLTLYNAATGEPVRQWTGHTDPIRALAFSGDGRLLATVAEDQTICVWSLSWLELVMGKRGMLVGLAVKDQKGELIVGQVEDDSPARGKVQHDQVIEGLVEDGKLKPLATARAFYDTISLRKPGETVTLRLRGAGDVPLRVGQAMDERKPLLFLFVTRAGPGQPREWVGWNPIGPYDASNRKTERLIGWHFNTGKPEAPTAFALADQYRKEYYREGILKHLVDKGSLSAALKSWEAEDQEKKEPEPKMTLWIDEVGPDPRQVDVRGQILVRRRPVTLKLAIDDFPIDKVDSVKWQVDGGPLQAFPASSSRERAADLSALLGRRGVHRVRVVARTQKQGSPEFARELTVRFQPPPPEVGLRGIKEKRLLVKDSEFKLEVVVRPSVADQAVTVKLSHKYQDQEQLDQTQEPGMEISQKLKLLRGDNLIEVSTSNKEALRGFEELETVRTTLLVTYSPKEEKIAPPRISLDQVVPLAAGGAEAMKIQFNQPVIVSGPRVRLVGKIQAEEKISKAVWKGKDVEAQTLARFSADKEPAFDIGEDLPPLQPGLQTFRFLAKTPGSDEAEARLILDYRPPLPSLVLTAPAPGARFFEGSDPREIQVRVRLTLPEQPHPFQAVVLVNGKETAATIHEQDLAARVVLDNGENRIQLRLSNAWNAVVVTGDWQVRYLRPPHHIEFAEPKGTEKAMAQLEAKVQSALPLDRDAVTAEVNGREITAIEVGKIADGWRVRLLDVPLETGKNEVRLWTSNSEGRSLKPGTVVVMHQPPAQPPAVPEVEILDPAVDAKVTEPDLALRFRVKSATPLKKIELVREGRLPLRQSFKPADGLAGDRGYLEFKAVVPLAARDNSLRVEAANDAGNTGATVVVNYVRMPVRLTIDSLEARDQPGIAPEVLSNSKLQFAPLPDGRVRLKGRVAWDRDTDEQLKKINQVRVYVNSFQQVPADLQPAVGTSRERAFAADLLLNRADDNKVEIALPDLKQEASNRRQFQVDCRAPARGQRLHLLIVGIGEKDESKLTEKALQALQAHQDSKGRCTTPVFEQVRTYGPLTGYVIPEQIFTQLCLIKKTIDLLATEGSANDVVMVYFEGGETVAREGHFFLTSVAEYDPELQRSAITCNGLSSIFSETLGAQILLLDVDRVASSTSGEGQDQVAKWPDDSNTGVLRYLKQPGRSDRWRERTLLLTDLRDLMPRASEWGEVVNLVRTKADKEQVKPALLVDQWFPAPLMKLAVGVKH